MSDPFVHLHVASGYSLRYGASLPPVLVERAHDHGMDTLALTDRDGVYGAVKFAQACSRAGLRPVLGADLTLCPGVGRPAAAGPRQPVRGGGFAAADHTWGLPRVTVLARDGGGWATLCRLVTAAHLAGERGAPVTDLALIRRVLDDRRAAGARGLAGAADAGLVVLLGPDSPVGGALARRRPDEARALLRPWRELVGPEDLCLEVVSHRGPGDTALAARLLRFAAEEGLPAVLSNAVRYADRGDAATADVLDAARRLVPLDPRHLDRRTAEGYLKSGKEMAELADEIARAAGLGESAGRQLLARTRAVADRCALDPRADLGIGTVHFPEVERVTGGGSHADAAALLRARCEAGFGRRGLRRSSAALARLADELALIERRGYPAYFLTVADVVDLIKSMGIRAAARGSGAGSLVTHLLGISDVDPLEHRLLMERFLSDTREALPDIDVDVESARRTEVYEAVLDRYGGDRCACVSMMDTYRVRHAVRDVGAALGLPAGEIDSIAKAFPHIRARQARAALRDLPELRASGLRDDPRLGLMFRLVERLDGLPRHVALHPCGVLLSDGQLLDRTPVEASWAGFPMSQFDKDDVEAIGLLKLDVLGVRMQSAIAHALVEVRRVDEVDVDIDAVPRDDPATFRLIRSTRTLGCFQIESPGQRELVGKFAPETFADLIIDISLFRPGPVKSDMVTPFLRARQGWAEPDYLHPSLQPFLAQTHGVVVFHEQVIELIATMAGCSNAQADEARRALGDPLGQQDVKVWFRSAALRRGYAVEVVDRVWGVLEAFASFGFCKAHAAAFAVPTYQSAWLKAHHPAAFLAGVLTHDPGMYPKRLILDDARQLGIAVLPLDVNRSDGCYRVERVGVLDEPPPEILGGPPRPEPDGVAEGLPDGRAYGIRLSLADVKGISDADVAAIVAGRPYHSLGDFWHRTGVPRPVAERLVVAGAFDGLYGLGGGSGAAAFPVRRGRRRVTRRDLLLQLVELDRWRRAAGPAAAALAAKQAQRTQQAQGHRAHVAIATPATQLALDLGDAPDIDPGSTPSSGLPEMTGAERVHAELEVLGLDASRHVLDFYAEFLADLGITRSRDLLRQRSRTELLVAGVKVATQTPPIRSGRRVVFVTLDDSTGPVDATFFEDAQVGYAATLFHSWLLVIRGVTRRTGPRGISLRATGAWELPALHTVWDEGGRAAVEAVLAEPPAAAVSEDAVRGAAQSRSTRPVMVAPPLRYASGFALSPYADVRPAGRSPKDAPRKLWHASPGSSGG